MPHPQDLAGLKWQSLSGRKARSYCCGFCGDRVSSEKGYPLVHPSTGNDEAVAGIFICPGCQHPTYITPRSKEQYPGVPFGKDVQHVPAELGVLYDEARRCTSASSFTAAVLACRKMLMNIAVKEGSKPGLSFLEYVDYLAKKGFVPPNGRHWVDHIRKKGNEANHEIAPMSQDDARELLTFVEMLLRFIYEFPNTVPQPSAA
jgi:hypothetical protein